MKTNPLQEQLNAFLAEHAELNGARILSYLLAFPGHKFHCTKLYHLVFPPDYQQMDTLLKQADLDATLGYLSDEENETLSRRNPANPQLITSKNLDVYDLADIITCRHYDNPLTDRKTLHDISLRIKQLQQDIRDNKSPAQAREEIQALYRYRSQCLYPGNKIKQFNPEIIKVYQAISQAIKRLLNKIPPDQAPLREYVKIHLKTGMEFKWK